MLTFLTKQRFNYFDAVVISTGSIYASNGQLAEAFVIWVVGLALSIMLELRAGN